MANFELIVINDGSTDSSWETIQTYNDPRLKAFTQENCNLPCTLNRGISLSQGNLIARMDQDDINRVDRLSKQVAYLQSHEDIGLLGTSYKVIDTDGNCIGNRYQITHPYHVKRQMYTGNPFAHGSVMFRRELVEQVNCYDVSAKIEDFDLWSRLTHVTSMANLPELLYSYRVGISSSMVSSNKEAYSDETHKLINMLWQSGSPEVLDRDSPREDLEFNSLVKNGSHNRTRRYLYNQVSLGIIKQRTQRGDRKTALREWTYLCGQNAGHPHELTRVVAGARWML